MKIKKLIKQLEDMRLLYGDKVILIVTDGESEYAIKSVSGMPCARYFNPEDKVAEVIITIGRRREYGMTQKRAILISNCFLNKII